MAVPRLRIDTGGFLRLDNCYGGIQLSPQAIITVGSDPVRLSPSGEPLCNRLIPTGSHTSLNPSTRNVEAEMHGTAKVFIKVN